MPESLDEHVWERLEHLLKEELGDNAIGLVRREVVEEPRMSARVYRFVDSLPGGPVLRLKDRIARIESRIRTEFSRIDIRVQVPSRLLGPEEALAAITDERDIAAFRSVKNRRK